MINSIPYEQNSFAGAFSERELAEFQEYLSREVKTFEFDPEYVEHIKAFHGGVPVNKRIRTAAGKERRIERFLNFLDTTSTLNKRLSVLNANVVWSNIEDRLGPNLVPFAELAGGDKLCFDLSDPKYQKVVCWFHELSEEDQPYTEIVASSFAELLRMLG